MTLSTIFGGVMSITANAEELTQIQNADDVDYSNHGADFTAEERLLNFFCKYGTSMII